MVLRDLGAGGKKSKVLLRYFIVPTAQLFPFDVNLHWPSEIAGQKMTTYHEWMKGLLPITMAGCPALAAPAGFNDQGLPIGIQIVAPNHAELSCLQLALAYDSATDWVSSRPPPLIYRDLPQRNGRQPAL
jgi:amidase